MKTLGIIFLTLFSLSSSASEYIDTTNYFDNALTDLSADRLWGPERRVSPAIYSITPYLQKHCREFELLDLPFPDKSTTEQCAFSQIFNIQETLMKNLNDIDHVKLPEGDAWTAVFTGIMAPVYDFEARDWQPYHVVANIILNQIAIENGLSYTKDEQGPIYQKIQYPAIMGSLFPGERLTYYLRAAKLTKCSNNFYSCEKIGDLTIEQTNLLLNNLAHLIKSTYKEIHKSQSNTSSLENWLIEKNDLQKITQKIRRRGYSATQHLEAINQGVFLKEHHEIAKQLEKSNIHSLDLPKIKYLNAIMASTEINEVYALLKQMGYPKKSLNKTIDMATLEDSKHTNTLVKKLNEIKNIFKK